MLSNGAQAADFIKVLAPTLKAANLSVGINCCENTGWSKTSQMVGELRSAGADPYLAVITSHGYTSAPGGALNTPHPVWQTEWSDLSGQWNTAWYSNGGAGDGMTWANNIYTGLTTSNCTGYLYWVATQMYNQNGQVNEKLIQINADNSFVVSKRLWAFGQFSRFVRPGAIRVGTSGGGGNLKTSAFKNEDGKVAVQVLNGGSSAASVSIKGVTGTAVQAWLTDNTHDLDKTTSQIASDGTVTGSVPARAMVSFVIS